MKRKFIGESEATATKAAACALAGGISGLTGWFFIYPLDAIKTRIFLFLFLFLSLFLFLFREGEQS